MLESDIIPKIEPTIRVGIVLSEDKINRLELQIPAAGIYTVSSAGINKKLNKGKIILQQEQDKINCSKIGTASTWLVSAPPASSLQPADGIKLYSVPAGRGFHWQKMIDVQLPGNLEFQIHDGYLLLINELPLEFYLTCVATAEMSAECPDAFLEAQTIAARSWILANTEKKHVRFGFDVCNDDCCQRYQGSANLTGPSIRAAEKTRGQVLLFRDSICDARYSKSCGGITEKFSTVWGGRDLDYLQVKPDTDPVSAEKIIDLISEQRVIDWINQIPGSYCSSTGLPERNLKKYLGKVDIQAQYFRWQVAYTQSEICSLLNAKMNLQIKAVLDLIPLERGGSGRIIRLQIEYIDNNDKRRTVIIQGDAEIRRILHRDFLYSSCIYFSAGGGKDSIPEGFKIHGAGWGHGVGLCQIGALGMALQGHQAVEIVSHYYPGSRLTRIYQ